MIIRGLRVQDVLVLEHLVVNATALLTVAVLAAAFVDRRVCHNVRTHVPELAGTVLDFCEVAVASDLAGPLGDHWARPPVSMCGSLERFPAQGRAAFL